jgi:hypothetical protein
MVTVGYTFPLTSVTVDIEKLEPDLIFNKLYSPEQPTRLKSAINIIKKDPETINGFQTLVKKDMQNSIKNEKDQFDFV